jgi:hypothetical protein
MLSTMLTQEHSEVATSRAPAAKNALPLTFEIASGVWRIRESPPSSRGPALAEKGRIREAHLSFRVSRDEEFVHLRMTLGDRAVDMGARGHNYLLLTLARQRLRDEARGLGEAACGWIRQDDLAHDPMMAPARLNIDVFRIRKQFAAQGLGDAVDIIERRPRVRQLRIGTGRLSVVRE